MGINIIDVEKSKHDTLGASPRSSRAARLPGQAAASLNGHSTEKRGWRSRLIAEGSPNLIQKVRTSKQNLTRFSMLPPYLSVRLLLEPAWD